MDPQQPGPSPQPGPYSQPGQPPPPPPHATPYPGPQYPPQYPPPYQHPYGAYPPPYPVREPRTVPAPEGTPYHRLARTPKHAWWRPLVGTVLLGLFGFLLTSLVVVVWVVVHRVAAGPFPSRGGTDIFPSDTENLAMTLVLLGVLTPLVCLVAWMVQRRPFWSVASVLNRIRWRWLAWCSLTALGYIALSFLMGVLVDAVFPAVESIGTVGGDWIGFGAFVVPALVILLLVPFQAAAEEFVFRGWLIQAVGAYGPDDPNGRARWLRTLFRSPWPGIVVGGVAFASAHRYIGWAMADIFLFAVVVGWLTVRTGGLEAAIAIHVMNNLIAFLLPAATGRGDQWDVQGSAPWTLFVADIPCLAFYLFAVTWLARRQEIRRLS